MDPYADCARRLRPIRIRR